MGFTVPSLLPGNAVRSYRTLSPLPANLRTVLAGGLLSVALSLKSPSPGVTRHPALWSPDFPPVRVNEPATTQPTPDIQPLELYTIRLKSQEKVRVIASILFIAPVLWLNPPCPSEVWPTDKKGGLELKQPTLPRCFIDGFVGCLDLESVS